MGEIVVGSFWKRVLIIVISVLLLNIVVCGVIEGVTIQQEQQNVLSATRVSANGALVNFNSLDFVNTANKSLSTYDLRNSKYRNTYLSYLNTIEAKAKAAGIYQSANISDTKKYGDVKTIIEFLLDSYNKYIAQTSQNIVFTPIQFGYTYLDKDKLTEDFTAYVEDIISANYSVQNNNADVALAFTGNNRVTLGRNDGINAVEISMSEPILITLQDDFTFKSIFGTNREEALRKIGAISTDTSYDYVIAYDVTFKVYWRHQTQTPFFRNFAVAQLLPNYFSQDGQLIIDIGEPVEYHKRYIITA